MSPFCSCRPFIGSRPTGTRPDSEPAQPRPFHLPPLDLKIPGPADDLPTEKPATDERPESLLAAQPEPAVQRFEELPSLRELLLNSEDMPAHTSVLGVSEVDSCRTAGSP